MGFLKDLVGIAAPIAGTVLGGPIGGAIGGALGGLASGSGQPKSQTATTQQQLDPRISAMLFGNGGSDAGLLSQYRDLLNQPRSDAANNFAKANAGYASYAGADLDASRQAAYRAMQGNQAPGFQAGGAQVISPAFAAGSDIKAPNQNNIDLTSSYQNLLSGGNTNALMNSLQAGNALTSAQFQQNQSNLTDNFTRNVLPSIRGGAIAAGQYGGSRQGIAEGNALSDFTKQLNQSNTQLGLANSANTANALAGAYENGQNRALSATQGLGAQQYNVAQQNAATRNQAEFMNVGNVLDVLKTNAGMQQQNNQFNASLGQHGQLATNALNSSNNLAGAGLLSGLLGNASNQVNANDNWQLGRYQGVNSLLAPYLSANSSQSTTQPLYQNRVGGALGGALAGSQLAGLFGGFGPGIIG